MPREVRSHLSDEKSDTTPKHLTKEQFGRRLHGMLMERRWNQSDLARASGLPRDSISTYIRGRVMPTPLSLEKMASALGVKAEDLLPNHTEAAIDRDLPALEVRVSTARPSMAWLRGNQMVSMTTAVKIAELLENDAQRRAKIDDGG